MGVYVAVMGGWMDGVGQSSFSPSFHLDGGHTPNKTITRSENSPSCPTNPQQSHYHQIRNQPVFRLVTLTGNFREPQRTECSRICGTPVESAGGVRNVMPNTWGW